MYDIGGGQTVVLKEFTGSITNTRVPGLQAILDYLQQNYYDKLDPAINYNYFTAYRKNITMIIIFTTQQQKNIINNNTYNITKKHINNDYNDTYNTIKKSITNINNHTTNKQFYHEDVNTLRKTVKNIITTLITIM